MFYLLFRATLPSILLSLSIMTLSLPPRSTLFPYTTLFRSYPLHVNGVVDFSNRCFSSNCRGDFSCCDVDYTCIDCLFIDESLIHDDFFICRLWSVVGSHRALS